MKRLLTCLFVVSVVVAGCGRGHNVQERPELRDASTPPAAGPVDSAFNSPAGVVAQGRPRIVFLGDSLSAGYGVAKEQSIPSLVQKHLDAEGYNYEVVNQGVSGDTSAGGVSRLEWSLSGNVRILVVELGGNDGLRGLPVPALRRNLEEIITRAQARGIAVLLVGMEAPPNYGASYTSEFRETFPALAKAHKVALMPFYLDGVAGKPEMNIADGIHPNPEGAVIVANNLWRTLQPMLQLAAQPTAQTSGSR